MKQKNKINLMNETDKCGKKKNERNVNENNLNIVK